MKMNLKYTLYRPLFILFILLAPKKLFAYLCSNDQINFKQSLMFTSSPTHTTTILKEASATKLFWEKHLKENLITDVNVQTFSSKENNNRPILILYSTNFNPQLPTKLQIYLHGDRWNITDKIIKWKLATRLIQVLKMQSQTVWIIPQAEQPSDKKRVWFKKQGSYNQMLKDVMSQLISIIKVPCLVVDHITLNTHSAAGYALENILNNKELIANKINLLDSTYNKGIFKLVEWLSIDKKESSKIEVWYTDYLCHSSRPNIIKMKQTQQNNISFHYISKEIINKGSTLNKSANSNWDVHNLVTEFAGAEKVIQNTNTQNEPVLPCP